MKKQLQSESMDLRGQSEAARNEISGMFSAILSSRNVLTRISGLKRQLQKRVQEVGEGFASSAAQSGVLAIGMSNGG